MTIESDSYVYDGAGNRSSITEGTTTTNYVYDGANQLTTVKSAGGATLATYAYDANHNRASMVTSTGTTTYTYDSADTELTQKTDTSGIVTTYAYDTNGNLTSATYDPTGIHQQTVYKYDTNNRLSEVDKPDGSVVTFSYDADGNRTSKSVTAGGTTTTVADVYQNGRIAYQTDGSGTLLATFTYDDNGAPTSVQVGSNPQTAPRYYYVYNGHGDVVTLADASGNIVASYSYDEFGVLTSSSERFPGGWSNPYRYDGRDDVRYDGETGLYWMSVRAYDPTLGRFISRDPLGRAPLMGWTSQPYAYAGNNPLVNVDPSGQRLAGASGATVRGAVVAHSATHTYASHPHIFLSRNVRDAENYSCDASCARRNAQFEQAFSAAEKSVKTQAQAAANQLNQLGDALQACAGASILLGLLATEAWGPFAAFLAGFWVWDLNEWSAEAHQLAGTFQSEAAHDYSWFEAGTIDATDQQVMGIRDKFLKKDFAFAGQLANIAAAILYWAKKIDLPRAFVAVVNSVVMYLGVLLIFNVGKRNIDEQGYILRSVSP